MSVKEDKVSTQEPSKTKGKVVESELKDADKVSVEMTEAEKDDFASWMAAKKLKEEKETEGEIEIDLKHEHIINGQAHGPGRVIVKEALGYGLLERDEYATKARMRVHEGNEFMIEIMGAGRSVVRQVKKAGL